MRSSLFVVVLMASVLPGLAVDICPAGFLPDQSSIQVVPSQIYTATDCTLNGSIQIGFVASSTAPSALSIKNSVVKDVLWINLVQVVNMTGGPLYITVENNVFEHNAIFCTRYSLPPNSVLTFQNNQMSGSRSMDAFGAGVNFSIGIRDLILFPDSVVNIIENTMTVNSPDDSIWIRPVCLDGEVSVSGAGKMNILRNTMSLYGAGAGTFIFVKGWEMNEKASLHIESNSFEGTNPRYLNIFQVETMSGNGNNLLTISNNNVDLSIDDQDSSVVTVGNFLNVDLNFDGNNITSNGNLMFHCHYTTFAPASYASFVGNRFASPIPIGGLYSLISIHEYRFIGNSTLVVARNTVTAPSVLGRQQFVDIEVPQYTAAASIVYCGNKLPWTDSSAPADQLFQGNVANMIVYDEDACLVTSAPATTTTTTPDFLQNTDTPSSSSLISAATALIVCLLTALVVLQ